MKASQMKLLVLLLAFKTIAAHGTVGSFKSATEPLTEYKNFSGQFANSDERQPTEPIDTYPERQLRALLASKQSQFTSHTRRPDVIGTIIRAMGNSIKVRNPTVGLSSQWTQLPNDTYQGLPTQEQEITSPSNHPSGSEAFSNVNHLKTDREGYSPSRDYLGNEFDHVDAVKSYGQMTPEHPQPHLPTDFATFIPSPPPPPGPLILGEPVSAATDSFKDFFRLYQQLPVQRVAGPIEVYHTIERQVPIPVPIVREVTRQMPVPVPIPLVRHVPFPQPMPFAVEKPIFIERRIPLAEPVPMVRAVLQVPPPPTPIRTMVRMQSSAYPIAVWKQRILAPFNGYPYGRFGRYLRNCCRSDSPHAYKR